MFISKERLHKESLPFQKSLVLELIHEIKTTELDIILSKKGPPDSSVVLTLFTAKNYIENKRELSLETYQDYKLYFTDNYNQVIDFKKYLNNPFIPEEIQLELKKFYNTGYTDVNPMQTYFILITGNDHEIENSESKSDGLYAGNGEAFKSWALFKESAHNLSYAIGQWIRDNCEPIDGTIYLELVEIDN